MGNAKFRISHFEFRIGSLDATRKHHHGMHGVQRPELLHDEEPAEAPRAGGVAEVLPAVQQAAATQGIEVVTTEALAPAKRNWVMRAVDFVRDVRGGIGKGAWPSWDEL